MALTRDEQDHFSNILDSYLSDVIYCRMTDLNLAVYDPDTKSTTTLSVHQALLLPLWPSLASIVRKNSVINDSPTIILDNIALPVLQCILDIVYTGRCTINSHCTVSDILKLIQNLGMEVSNLQQIIEDQDSPVNNNLSTALCGINQITSTTDSPSLTDTESSLQGKDLNYKNCDEKLSSPINLVYRMQVAHCNTSESVAAMLKCIHVCEYCGKRFTRQKTLANHVILHTEDKNYSCTQCGAKFAQLNSLLVHWKKHIGKVVVDPLEDLVCKVCGRKFKHMKHLRRHKAVHSSVKFSCNMCESTFRRKDRMTAHMKTKHAENAVHSSVKFSCNLCQSTFSRKDKLTAHMKKKHGQNAYDDSMLCETAKYENDKNFVDSEVEIPLGNDVAMDSSDISSN